VGSLDHEVHEAFGRPPGGREAAPDASVAAPFEEPLDRGGVVKRLSDARDGHPPDGVARLPNRLDLPG